MSELRSYFSPFGNLDHQITSSYAGEIVNAVFRLSMSCSCLEIFSVRCHQVQMLDVFWPRMLERTRERTTFAENSAATWRTRQTSCVNSPCPRSSTLDTNPEFDWLVLGHLSTPPQNLNENRSELFSSYLAPKNKQTDRETDIPCHVCKPVA